MVRLVVFLLFCASIVGAQTLSAAASVSSEVKFEPALALRDLELDDFKLDLYLAGGVSDALEFGVRVRGSQSFGPVGNLAVLGQADAATDGKYQLSAAASGVVTSVALGAKLSAFNTDEPRFQLANVFSEEARAFLVPTGLSGALDMSASYRFNRSLIGDAALSGYLTPAGFGTRLRADLQFRGLFDGDDGTARLLAYLSPGLEAGFAAAGFEYDLNQRGLPSVSGTLWLGAGSEGVWPGLSGSLSQNLRNLGARYDLKLWLEPYRTDLPIARASAVYSQTVQEGKLELAAYASYSEDIPPLTVSAAYSFDF